MILKATLLGDQLSFFSAGMCMLEVLIFLRKFFEIQPAER